MEVTEAVTSIIDAENYQVKEIKQEHSPTDVSVNEELTHRLLTP